MMFENERAVYAMNLGLLRASVKDLTAEQMVKQVSANVNTPVWILGHLATTSDNSGRMLGLERVLPESWHQQFGQGSGPVPTLSPMPTKEELMHAIEAAHERVSKATERADATVLNQPHPVEMFRNSPVQTVGQLLALIMTMHEGFHIGQLSVCRRQMGFAPMF